MPRLYAGAELLVYPSLYEGFGLPPLETMGCGCPAIVADRTSLPEVVTAAGHRFDPHNGDELQALLQRAISRPFPLNPGFQRGQYSENAARDAYLSIFAELARR
jgi:glycosyltransferase involved in cell wall biosynthesis